MVECSISSQRIFYICRDRRFLYLPDAFKYLYLSGTPVFDFSCKLLIVHRLRHSEGLGPARMSN